MEGRMATDDQCMIKALEGIRYERRRLIASHVRANFSIFLELAELEGNIKTIKALHKLNNHSVVKLLVE
jgi:hypothetical protein